MKNSILIFFALCTICLASCRRQFEPIKYGRDACTRCKMTIMDNRFAAEILTGKGKSIKFDDFGCLLEYIKAENFKDRDAKIFVADYNHPGAQFIDARRAVFIHNETFKSPMNGNLAATASEQVAILLNNGSNGKLLNWIALSK